MDKAKELVFQRAIVDDLTADGWLEGKAEDYNRELALYPGDLLGYLKETQPEAIDKLTKFYHEKTEQMILKRAAEQMDKHGALHVLFLTLNRHYDDLGRRGYTGDLFSGRDSVHVGHIDIHEDNAGLQLFGLFDGLVAILGRPHDLDVRLEVQELAKVLPGFGDIVNDENRDLFS